jgi:hypothetical protein
MRTPLFATPAQRLAMLHFCAAIYGFACGASLLPIWAGPPRPGQLPGYITSMGLDAHAPFRLVIGLMVLTIAMPLLLRPLLRRLAGDDARAWARNAAASAMLLALWYVIIRRDPYWTVLPALIAIVAFTALRHFRARFTRWDAILVPTFVALYLAHVDLRYFELDRIVVVAIASLIAVRLGVAAIRRHRTPPALYFALSPLAMLLQAHFNGRDIRYAPWPPMLLALLSPFVLAFLIPGTSAAHRKVRKSLAYAIYPMVVFAYVSATGVMTAEGKPRASLFEDGHHMVPAREMMRGDKPYRDIVPAHGFLQDGGLDYVAMRTGRDTAGELLKIHGFIDGLGSIAVYALTTLATASPNAGLLACFLGGIFGAASSHTRPLPALIFLAFVAYALRRRDPKRFVWAGAMVSIATLVSLDFGAYSFLTLVFALFRANDKRRALQSAAIGVAAVAGPFMIALAIAGLAWDYIHTTFFEVLTLGPVYTLMPFDQPPGMEKFHFLPEALLAVFDKTSFLYITWIATLVLVATALAMPREPMTRRRARFEALLAIAFLVILTAFSYAERHHLYNHFFTGPLAGVALFLLFRARNAFVRRLAPVAIAVALMAGYPTLHLVIVAMVRNARGPLDQGWRELPDIPAARGALFHDVDSRVIESAKKYADRLPPGTTWFDFSNRGNLYFLLDRDCPIRHIEVAFYETEERQRDVIRRLEANPRVVAALVPMYPEQAAVDGVPNATRAPLVWKYLEENFEPDWSEGDVAFWRRRGTAGYGPGG